MISRRRRSALTAFTLAVVAGSAACRDLTGIGDLTGFVGGRLVSIYVSGPSQVHVGDTVRFTAAGQIDGLMGLLSIDPVRDAQWTTSNSAIARLETPPPPAPDDSLWTGRILVRGLRPGTVTIAATARRVRGAATLSVVP